jgi:hypothetical protein
MEALLLLFQQVDPIAGATNFVYKLVGFGGALILLVIVFRGLGLLNQMAIQGIIGLIAIGILLMLFADGENSKQLLQTWADWIMKYVSGEET